MSEESVQENTGLDVINASRLLVVITPPLLLPVLLCAVVNSQRGLMQ